MRAGPEPPGPLARQRAAQGPGPQGRQLLRASPSGGRAHRLEPAGLGCAQPDPCGGSALPGRIQRRCGQAHQAAAQPLSGSAGQAPPTDPVRGDGTLLRRLRRRQARGSIATGMGRPGHGNRRIRAASCGRLLPTGRMNVKKVLILGVNGFIGHHLSKRIIETTDWEVHGMDMFSDKVKDLMGNSRFHFFEGDITINREWVEYHVRKCDVVLPLVAIATPATYVKDPLRVFELDFEANLPIVRQCVKYKKRVLFPSTSEVYGMCRDAGFDPYTSELILGPIN